MFQSFRRIALSILAAAALSATFISPVAAAQDAKPLKIGIVVDQSANLKEYGLEYTQGFALGLKYATNGTMTAGGRALSTVIRDDTNKADTAASAARDLIENQGVELLAGSTSSGVEVQMQKIASDYNIPLFAGPAASAAAGRPRRADPQIAASAGCHACQRRHSGRHRTAGPQSKTT